MILYNLTRSYILYVARFMFQIYVLDRQTDRQTGTQQTDQLNNLICQHSTGQERRDVDSLGRITRKTGMHKTPLRSRPVHHNNKRSLRPNRSTPGNPKRETGMRGVAARRWKELTKGKESDGSDADSFCSSLE